MGCQPPGILGPWGASPLASQAPGVRGPWSPTPLGSRLQGYHATGVPCLKGTWAQVYLTLGILGSRAKGPRPREPRPGLVKNIPFHKESFLGSGTERGR